MEQNQQQIKCDNMLLQRQPTIDILDIFPHTSHTLNCNYDVVPLYKRLSPPNFLVIPQDSSLTFDFLAPFCLLLKKPVELYGGQMYYMQQNLTFSSNPNCNFHRIKSQFSGKYTLVLSDTQVSTVTNAILSRLSSMVDPSSGAIQTDITAAKFYQFAQDFKVFDLFLNDITDKYKWQPCTCTFLFVVNGLYKKQQQQQQPSLQIKVKQMKVIEYHQEAVKDNSICYL